MPVFLDLKKIHVTEKRDRQSVTEKMWEKEKIFKRKFVIFTISSSFFLCRDMVVWCSITCGAQSYRNNNATTNFFEYMQVHPRASRHCCFSVCKRYYIRLTLQLLCLNFVLCRDLWAFYGKSLVANYKLSLCVFSSSIC